jgi:hypothetical protein
LLFADRVITENNGKRGIIGAFNCFNFRSIPAASPPWFAFISLDNLMEGPHQLTINVARRGTSEVVFSGGMEFRIPDPSRGFEVAFPIPPLQFPKDGQYVVSLTVDAKDLHERLMQVNLVPSKEA